jgi:phage terminase large subunit-like protein
MTTWSTACPDWEERIRTGHSLITFPPLFPDEAAAALGVFNELRVVDIADSPKMGQVAGPWVQDFVSAIFGSYDPDSGKRLISEFLLLISKKNSKSTTAAEIMLTVLIRNWRKSAEFLILAPTVEVANNSFYPARDSILADPELKDLMHVQEHVRTITHRVTGATLKVVAAENEAVGGKKSAGTLIEELWMFGKKANAENMLREATGGMASRPEGFTIYLTTQSDEPPAGVFRKKLLYARKVRDGEIHDPCFLPVLYEFPKAMLDAGDHLKPENFHITNPNIGASVSRQYLVRELDKAQEDGADSLAGFLAKHLNVEIGLSLRSNRWAGADHWQKCGVEQLTLDDVLRRSDAIDIGIDGGGLDDLLGLAVIGRDANGKWLLWTRAWAHPSVMERRKSEATRFADFAAAGNLVIVDRIGDDVGEVADIVQRIDASGVLDKVGVDPHGLGGIYDALLSVGIEAERIVGISQGWKLTGAIKTLERRLAEGQVEHGGQPLMTWCVGNAKVEPRGNAITITKQAAGFAKIDPLMAAFNATTLMSLNPEGSGRSFWDTRAA